MKIAEIKYRLAVAGMTQKAIADALGIKQPVVSAVIARRNRSEAVERSIAAAIGEPVHVVWPEWFAADGSRLETRRRVPRPAAVQAVVLAAQPFRNKQRIAA